MRWPTLLKSPFGLSAIHPVSFFIRVLVSQRESEHKSSGADATASDLCGFTVPLTLPQARIQKVKKK